MTNGGTRFHAHSSHNLDDSRSSICHPHRISIAAPTIAAPTPTIAPTIAATSIAAAVASVSSATASFAAAISTRLGTSTTS